MKRVLLVLLSIVIINVGLMTSSSAATIIEKQEFNGLELCTGLPQFPVLKQEEKGGK